LDNKSDCKGTIIFLNKQNIIKKIQYNLRFFLFLLLTRIIIILMYNAEKINKDRLAGYETVWKAYSSSNCALIK
jgi:hypothetical protein